MLERLPTIKSGGFSAAATQGMASRKRFDAMSEGVVRRDRALIEMKDFPMPEKTYDPERPIGHS